MTNFDKQLDALNTGPTPALPAEPVELNTPIAPPPPLPDGSATAPSPYAPTPPVYSPAAGPRPAGRRYGFLCNYCSSRLEATESMAGQSGTCPTCGNTILIPILDHRGRLIDPTTGQIVKQDPHPVHAYAAAGHRAPQIVAINEGADRKIRCPRCQRDNPLSANNCAGCGLPFTMDGTVGDAISGTNTWAVASLVLGIVSLVGAGCFIVPPILAIIFGFIALRGGRQTSSPQAGNGLAIAGVIMGFVALALVGLYIFFVAMR